MRPLALHGHSRPLNKIRYNRLGDLLFSCGKEGNINVWFSHNGERLGTYQGHKGTVWSIDVSFDSSRLVTGAADNTVKIWDVQTGKVLNTFETESAVRDVAFAMGDSKIAIITDNNLGNASTIKILSIENDEFKLISSFDVKDFSKPTVILWANLNEIVITGHDKGEIVARDVVSGKVLQVSKEHTKTITDIQLSKDYTHFISSSKDCTAKIHDINTFKVVKAFATDRPVNSASLSPLRDEVILGGGQEASEVTTTDASAGKFEVRFFHSIFEDEIGRVKGHFGPINTVCYHPSGKGFASGGEDGYIRVHEFDEDYFDFEYPFTEDE